jgi:hypothetical protein
MPKSQIILAESTSVISLNGRVPPYAERYQRYQRYDGHPTNNETTLLTNPVIPNNTIKI